MKKRILSLLLVLVMLLGLLPTVALAADVQDIDVVAHIRGGTKGTCTFVPPYFQENDIFVQESYDVFFQKVTGGYSKLHVMDTGSLYPDYSANIDGLEGIVTVERKEACADYKTMLANYEQAKSCISGITQDNKAEHLLAFICMTNDDDELEYGYLLIEWEKGAETVDKSGLKTALEKVPTTGYYTENDRYNGNPEQTITK